MTQHEIVLMGLARDRTGKWFYPQDFMSGDLFVGYEASARLSELTKLYPLMIEAKREGKYVVRRINWEQKQLWYQDLPRDVKAIIDKYGVQPKAVSWLDEL